MYLNHYNLKTKPFSLSPGPKFLWLGAKHSEALATLKYGVQSDMGFLVMTGDVGVGKTALIHRLISKLDPSTIVAHITDPGVSVYDFFRLLADEYSIAKEFRNKAEFLLELKNFLLQSHLDKKSVLLIVDEAQRLNDKLLDEIRVLSNIELSNQKLINIFFVGQPEFIGLVATNKNRAIRQRIAINYHIYPLTEDETGQYIEHRLKMAGANRQIFEPSTIPEIFRVTGGYPRAINVLCDHALVDGYASGLQSISPEMIIACERGLNIRAGLSLNEADTHPPTQKKRPEPVATSSPQSWHRGVPLLLGLGIVAAVLAGYYLILLEPRWSNQPNTQSEIKESDSPSGHKEAGDQSQTPAKIEIADTASPEETVTHDKETTRDQQTESDHQPATIIANISPPADALPDNRSLKEDVTATHPTPSSVAEPGSLPDWNNWQKTDEHSVLSVEDNTTDTEDPPTVSVVKTKPATNPSAADRLDDSQTTETEKTVKGATVVAVLADAQPKSPQDQGAPDSQTTGKSEAIDLKQGGNNGSSARQTQAETTVSPSPAPVEKKHNQSSSDDKAPPPTDTSPEKVSHGDRPEPSITAKTELSPQSSLEQSGAITASAEQLDVTLLENRVRSFLELYSSTYAAKDLSVFTTFFAANAIENGKPFDSLLPKYERNFNFIETIQYQIELKQFLYDETKQLIKIEGDFFLRWLPPDKKWRENSGKIFMDLQENGPTFLVQRLSYHGQRSKK